MEMFDLSDVGSTTDTSASVNDFESLTDLLEWADEAIKPRSSSTGGPAFYDIETGPRPASEIECFFNAPPYVPLAPFAPWDESMVKYGNAKRDELKKQKRDEQFAEYQALLAGFPHACEAHKREWEGKVAVAKEGWMEKAALSPVTGRVLLIGMLWDDKPLFMGESGDETEALTTFWKVVDDFLSKKVAMIGHNSNGFDLPFLIRRSWALGVPVPHEVRQGRFFNPLFKDTMETWNCGARDYVKLDVLGQFFGVGRKTEGVDGKDFSRLWFGQMPAEQWGTFAEQRAKAIEYNGQDLEVTAGVARKMGMV